MNTAPLSAERIVDGRTAVDGLPLCVGVFAGEVELVAQHLLDALDALLAGRLPPSIPASGLSCMPTTVGQLDAEA